MEMKTVESWEDKKKHNEKQKSKASKIKNKIIEIIKESTMHGLPSVFRSERIFFKIMWFILFLISLTVGTWTILNSILDYLSFNVVT